MQAWARDGLTDEQIAKNMGISRSTLNEWRNKYPDISDTLKKGKEIVDIVTENALYKKAIGIKEILKKPIKVKEVVYDNGKRVKETEKIEYADEEVYFPPDVTALIFWLKNRKPDKWKDKPIEVADNNNEKIAASIERLSDIIATPTTPRKVEDFE